jgi:hypothetical protein
MLEAILVAVIAALIGAGILAGLRWLAQRDNREKITEPVRQRLCDHQWEPINRPGDVAVLITADDEWCTKCGARRQV